MKLEDICVSLELARELKENNYPQESLFYWVKKAHSIEVMGKGVLEYAPEAVICAAPTAADIGEKLPYAIITEKRHNDEWMVFENAHRNLKNNNPMYTYKVFKDYSEVDARAKMWLFLKKEGLIK